MNHRALESLMFFFKEDNEKALFVIVLKHAFVQTQTLIPYYSVSGRGFAAPTERGSSQCLLNTPHTTAPGLRFAPAISILQ